MCPGTDVYMPPEAVQEKTVYTEKIDCFLFGVITVQILIQRFSKPGDQLQNVELNHPGLPTGKLLVQVPEVNRQQNHINEVDPNHPLLPVALNCLKDKDNERPSAHQLCERVADLKEMPEYRDSIQTVRRANSVTSNSYGEKDPIREEENQQLRHQLQQSKRERNQTIGFLNQQLKQLQEELRKKDQTLEERERQLGRTNHQLESSEQMTAQFEQRIAELEQQLGQRNQKSPEGSNR